MFISCWRDFLGILCICGGSEAPVGFSRSLSHKRKSCTKGFLLNGAVNFYKLKTCINSKSAKLPRHPQLRSVYREFPPGRLCTEHPSPQGLCLWGQQQLTLTSATLLTWEPWDCCCSRQKAHRGLRQHTYHYVRNSWMWQECHVPIIGRGQISLQCGNG